MGEDQVIDTLRIEIVGDSTNATKGLEKLIATLERLDKLAGGGSKGLRSLSNTLDKLEKITSSLDAGAADKVVNLAEGLKSLSGISLSARVANNLARIVEAARGINDVDVGRFSDLASAAGTLNAGRAANAANNAAETAAGATSSRFDGTVEIAATRVEAATDAVERNREVVQRAGETAEKAGKKGEEAAKKVEKSTTRLHKSSRGLFGTLKRIETMFVRRLMYRAMNYVISGITRSIVEGTNAVYLYSKSIGGDLAKSMDNLATSAKYVKGSLGAMFSPLIITAAPILENIMDRLVNFLNIVNQVISRLSGRSTWTKAVKTMQEYTGATKAANKAANKLKNTILGIDELNTLNDNSDYGSGAASALDGYNFVEVPIDVNYVDGIISKLEKMLKIVTAIGVAFTAWRIIKGFGKIISGFSRIFSGFFGHSSGGGGGLSTLGSLALALGGLPSIVTTIGGIMSIPGLQEAMDTGIDVIVRLYKGLWEVALQIAATSLYITLMGRVDVKTVALGLANMAIVIGGTDVLITAVGGIMSIPGFSDFMNTGVDTIITLFKGIGEVGNEIAATSLLIAGLGFVTPEVMVSGIEGLAVVVGGLETLLTALGGLKQIPGFTWIVGEGGEVLAQLGNILGGFAGSIIDGFIDKATESIPEIGTRLSDFMVNLRPFLDGAANIDEGTLENVSRVAEAVLMITAAELLDAIASFLGSKDTIEKFINYLPSLGEGVTAFAEKTKDIDKDKLNAAIGAVSVISAFVAVVPREGGLFQLIGGSTNYKEFFNYLPTMGEKVRQFSENIDGFKSTAVLNAKDGAEVIMALADKVPKTEGLIPWIAGTADIEAFSTNLPNLGTALKDYSTNIEGMKTQVVEDTESAVAAIVVLANALPASGGWWQDIFGSHSLSGFGFELATFGSHFKNFYERIMKVETTKVQAFTNVLSNLVTLILKIKDKEAEDTIVDFAESLVDSQDSFSDFLTADLNWSTGYNVGYSFGTYIVSGIKDAFNNVNLLSYQATKINGATGTRYQLTPTYAEGGFVDAGQMFIANEAGPELVGRIGRRTAVANGDQIVESVAFGVSEANEVQNQLLREQNELLRELIAKDTGGGDISTDSLIEALRRNNRRTGKTIIPVGV